MQEIICAKVSERLLTKASRLFTGTLDGRIIEILQNARRAGATEVRITNKNGFVTVEDNGSGIEDFQRLLDLGGSGWDEQLEAGDGTSAKFIFNINNLEEVLQMGDLPDNLDKIIFGKKDENIALESLDDGVDLILELSSQKPFATHKFKKENGEWLLLNEK